MTCEEQRAYRQGQEDMRRRIAERWRGWFVSGFGLEVASTATAQSRKIRSTRKSIQAARVDLKIRRTPIGRDA